MRLANQFLEILGLSRGVSLKNVEIRETRRQVDLFLLIILLLHFPFAAFVVPIGYGTSYMGLANGFALSALAILSFLFFRGTLFLRIFNGMLLMAYSALFIQLQLGRIEMHFHIFVALALLVAYRDWRAILPPAAMIAVHHGLFNYCQEYKITVFGIQPMVFNYGNGWGIVLVHAVFVVFEALILIDYAYRFEKQMRDQNLTINQLTEEHNRLSVLIKEASETTGTVKVSALEITSMMDEVLKRSQEQASTLEQMAAGMEEISASIDTIALTTRDESESLNEIEGKMQDLTASTHSMSTEIKNTEKLVRNTTEHAIEGERSLHDMVDSMDHIAEGSQKMIGIVGIINEIADRVNLLSLNASIEAARAGDAGRGFAVVAEEISKLADRTATSIKDITNLIQISTSEIERGKTIVGQNSIAISGIISDVNNFDAMIKKMSAMMNEQLAIYKVVYASINSASLKSKGIKASTEEQKRGIDEIVSGISLVTQITQDTVSRSERLNLISLKNKKIVELLEEKMLSLK